MEEGPRVRLGLGSAMESNDEKEIKEEVKWEGRKEALRSKMNANRRRILMMS